MKHPRTLANIGIVFMTQVAARAFTALTLVIVLKHLTAAEYGAVAVLQSIIGIGSGLFLQGLNWSMIRSLAAAAREGKAGIAQTVSMTLLVEVVLLIVQTIVLLAFSQQLLQFFHDSEVTSGVVYYAVAGIASTALLTFASSVFQGLERFKSSSGLLFAQVVLVLIVYAACSVAGWMSMKVVLLTMVVAPILPFLVALRRIPFSVIHLRDVSHNLLQPLRASRWLISYTFLILLVNQLDVLMMARYFSLEDVGVYGLATRVYSVVLLSLGAIHTVLLPRLSSTPELTFLRSFFWKTLKWTIPGGIALSLPVIIWAEPIVVLLSKSSFAGAATPLRILMAGAFLSLVLSPFANILFALHRERFVALSGLLLCALEWLGHLTVTRQYGSVGAACVVVGGNAIVNTIVAVRAFVATRQTPGIANTGGLIPSSAAS